MNPIRLLSSVIFSLGTTVLIAGPENPVSILKNWVQQTESFQESLVFGKEYECRLKRKLADGSNNEVKYKVKKYDSDNWNIEKHGNGKIIVFGQNDRYIFGLEKTNDSWRKLFIAKKQNSVGLANSLGTELEVLNPLVFSDSFKIDDSLNNLIEFSNTKQIDGEIKEISFECYDKTQKDSGNGPIQQKIIFRNAPTKNFSYIEKTYKNYKPETIYKSTRKLQLKNQDEIDFVKIDYSYSYTHNNILFQEHNYMFSEFRKTERLKDNFVSYYGLPEPSSDRFPWSHWYTSFWSLTGFLFFLVGGGGILWFRHKK